MNWHALLLLNSLALAIRSPTVLESLHSRWTVFGEWEEAIQQHSKDAWFEFQHEFSIGVTGKTDDNLWGPNPKQKGEYFRPVSVTVRCVMILTVQSLLIYTALAFARNSDELAGLTEPSCVTDTLQTAARNIAFAPMMCMLFVGCRMYVLATTEGLGEPQPWAKQAMMMATAGLTLQFFVTLTLPMVTTPRTQSKFSIISGENFDAHPMLKKHEFLNGGVQTFYWFLQLACMVAIYGGVATVIYAIRVYPQGTTKPSPSVICVTILTAVYFTILLMLWIIRTATEEWFDPSVDKKQESALGWQPKKSPPAKLEKLGGAVGAAESASQAVKKAPMLAVLFLAARMRALQLNPPQGLPPAWANTCFYAITFAIIVEVCVAAAVGASGIVSQGYYGTPSFRANTALHAVQHLICASVIAAVVPIYYACLGMKAANGEDVPLSTTVKCCFMFAGLYFGIESLKLLALFINDVCRYSMRATIETFTAAGISVSFCPLLCILFVACRMRALQITQQQGSPQEWAQNCMFVCVFATSVQSLSCLLLPIFTGGATRTDPDGNVVHDLRPMIGAYAVTVVKYVALFALHGSVAAICCSIYMITPDTAAPHGPPSFDMYALLEMCGIALLTLLVAMLLGSAKVVGLAVKFAIESVDDTLLGVQITIRAAALAICRGYVNVNGLVVHNPEPSEGEPADKWESECLASVESLVVKINIGRLICSLGKEFEITTIELHGVHVNFEKKQLIGGNSNVGEVVDHLNRVTGGEETLDAESKKKKSEKDAEAAKQAAEIAKKKEHDAKANKQGDKEQEVFVPQIIIHEISIRDIRAAALVKGVACLVAVKDIEFPDFMQHLGDTSTGAGKAQAGAKIMGLIVGVVMGSIMKSVLLSVQENMGKDLAKKLRTSLSVQGMASHCAGLGSFIKRKLTGDSASPPLVDEAVKAEP
jgi:hypothetical protein